MGSQLHLSGNRQALLHRQLLLEVLLWGMAPFHFVLEMAQEVKLQVQLLYLLHQCRELAGRVIIGPENWLL